MNNSRVYYINIRIASSSLTQTKAERNLGLMIDDKLSFSNNVASAALHNETMIIPLFTDNHWLTKSDSSH